MATVDRNWDAKDGLGWRVGSSKRYLLGAREL
jgi:hypothetical protein